MFLLIRFHLLKHTWNREGEIRFFFLRSLNESLEIQNAYFPFALKCTRTAHRAENWCKSTKLKFFKKIHYVFLPPKIPAVKTFSLLSKCIYFKRFTTFYPIPLSEPMTIMATSLPKSFKTQFHVCIKGDSKSEVIFGEDSVSFVIFFFFLVVVKVTF